MHVHKVLSARRRPCSRTRSPWLALVLWQQHRWLCTEMLLLLSALSGPAAPAEVLSGLAELTLQGLRGAPPQLGAQKWLSAAPGVRKTSTRPARRSLCCPSGLSSLDSGQAGWSSQKVPSSFLPQDLCTCSSLGSTAPSPTPPSPLLWVTKATPSLEFS